MVFSSLFSGQVFKWAPVLDSRFDGCPHWVCDYRFCSGPIKPKIPLISVLDLATKNLSLSLSLMDGGLQAHIEHGPISEYHAYCPVHRPHIKPKWSVLTYRALGARLSRVCLNLWWMIRFEFIFRTLVLRLLIEAEGHVQVWWMPFYNEGLYLGHKVGVALV